jgi:hypothetical protein
MNAFIEREVFPSGGVLAERYCACETPSAPPAPSPTITGTSGQVMMYDDSNGATPATLGLVPSNPSFPAICYPLSGASETFTWIPSKGIWI